MHIDTEIKDYEIDYERTKFIRSTVYPDYWYISAWVRVVVNIDGKEYSGLLETGSYDEYNAFNQPTNTLRLYDDNDDEVTHVLLAKMEESKESDFSHKYADELNAELYLEFTAAEYLAIYYHFKSIVAKAQDIINEEEKEKEEQSEMLEQKKQALAQHLDTVLQNPEREIRVSDDDDCEFLAAGGVYLVLTNDEANQKWEESLNDYIIEVMMPDPAAPIPAYFNAETWKRDARAEGRGAFIARYDGVEHGEDVSSTEFYIYRMH